MLMAMPDDLMKATQAFSPKSHDVVSRFDALIRRNHIWNLEILYDHLGELGLSGTALRDTQSFCRRWHKAYLSDLKHHVIRTVQGYSDYKRTVQPPELNSEEPLRSVDLLDLVSDSLAGSAFSPIETLGPAFPEWSSQDTNILAQPRYATPEQGYECWISI
jgi:hypothetical protein